MKNHLNQYDTNVIRNPFLTYAEIDESPEQDDDVISFDEEEIAVIRQKLLYESLNKLSRSNRNKAECAEIIEWIESDDEHPFSFCVCCDECGLNPARLRSMVLYQQKKIAIN